MDYIDWYITVYDDFAASFSFSMIKVWEENKTYLGDAKVSSGELIKIFLSAKIYHAR